MSPSSFTSHHYFAADLNLNGTDTHWLVKLTEQDIFYCLCVLVCVWAPVCSSPCVLQEFMGWCHSYAVLPSRDLQNSHLRFYAVWQSRGRGHQGHSETTSFMAQTNLRGVTVCQRQGFYSVNPQGNGIFLQRRRNYWSMNEINWSDVIVQNKQKCIHH